MKKFYFLMLALMVGLAASATDYYLVGGFNNWTLKDASCKFSETAESGIYTLKYNGTLSGDFKINDGSWSGSVNFGSNGSMLVPGTPYSYSAGSQSNIQMENNVENPTLTLNINAQTLLIEGQQVQAELKYGIHGEIFGDPKWSTENMTLTNGKWVLANQTVVAGDFGIKPMDKATSAQNGWINSANGATVTLDAAMPCVKEGEGSGVNWTIAAGTYTFTFDLEAMTLTVTEDGGDQPGPGPEVTPLYLVGANTGWTSTAANKMTAGADGNYTITLPKLNGDFKITTDIVDNTWDDNLTFSAQTALNLGQEYECESGVPMMSNMSVAGLGATDVTVNFNINTKMIKVTGTPIAEVVTKYYIKGDFRDLSWPSVEMVQGADNLYHATIIPHVAECTFVVYKTNDDVEAGFYKGATAVVGETVTLQNDKGGNATVTLTPLHTYDFVFNPETLELSVDQTSGVADIEAADELPTVYYNLQGVRVANPENGLYLEVRGNNVRKVVK